MILEKLIYFPIGILILVIFKVLLETFLQFFLIENYNFLVILITTIFAIVYALIFLIICLKAKTKE